jgi:capsular exopolysaccharide synthesis family protein
MAITSRIRGKRQGNATAQQTPPISAASRPARSGSAAARAASLAAAGYPELAVRVRALCTRWGWTQQPSGNGRTLAISSAVTGEGKTSLAAATAISMAQDHECGVLLVECDLWRGTVAQSFGVPAQPGMADILGGQIGWQGGGWPTRLPNLFVLPAGTPSENPSRLLRSPRMAAFVELARQHYGFVIFDLPALSQTSDAAVLAALTDGVVLVVRAGRTDQRAVARTARQFAEANLLGVVLNGARRAVPDVITRMLGGRETAA